jgi:hypothetical protein
MVKKGTSVGLWGQNKSQLIKDLIPIQTLKKLLIFIAFFVIVSDLLELKEICEGLCIACISLDCPFLHCSFGILVCLGAGVLLIFIEDQNEYIIFNIFNYKNSAPEFTPGFKWGSCYSMFSFICMYFRSLLSVFIWSLYNNRCSQ